MYRDGQALPSRLLNTMLDILPAGAEHVVQRLRFSFPRITFFRFLIRCLYEAEEKTISEESFTEIKPLWSELFGELND